MGLDNSTYSKLIDNTIELYVMYNEKGDIIYANDKVRETFGYGEELIGNSIAILFPTLFETDDRSDIVCELTEGIKEVNAYRKNQTCFLAAIDVIKVEDTKPFFVMHINNIQKQVELEKKIELMHQELEKSNAHQTQFVANVTHELRTPVNGIKGHVEFLMSHSELTEEERKTLKIIEQCCCNMEKIINNLLDFAKMDAGKFSISNEPFSFREMMEQVLQTNIKQANKKGIMLTMSIADSIPDKLYGDALRIGQILNNLISNAVKFTSVGFVRVEAVDVNSNSNEVELFFMVMDTGIGVAKEDMGKLFHDFSQVDGSITRQYGGTGLGLVVSKQLVEMMGGSIKVESEKGKGTTFAFSIYVSRRPEDEITDVEERMEHVPMEQEDFDRLIAQAEREDISSIYVWGTPENREELTDTLNKLVLCIEMRSWEKAENFADKMKSLTQGADMEIKKQIFRLAMAVRKEDYEQSMSSYRVLIEYRDGGCE